MLFSHWYCLHIRKMSTDCRGNVWLFKRFSSFILRLCCLSLSLSSSLPTESSPHREMAEQHRWTYLIKARIPICLSIWHPFALIAWYTEICAHTVIDWKVHVCVLWGKKCVWNMFDMVDGDGVFLSSSFSVTRSLFRVFLDEILVFIALPFAVQWIISYSIRIGRCLNRFYSLNWRRHTTCRDVHIDSIAHSWMNLISKSMLHSPNSPNNNNK